MRSRVAGGVAIAVALGALGCDSRPERDSPPPASSAAAASSIPGAPSAESSAAPGASGTAGAAAAAETLAGSWEGHYDAKKGSVAVPQGVKDKTWVTDDGKTAIGPGTIEITVSASGDVAGKGKGALGDCTLIGKAEGTTVRLSVLPEDPTKPTAMTGVMVVLLKEGGVLRGELRVAGPNASVVREAPIELKRK